MKPCRAKNEMATETLAAVNRGLRNNATSSRGWSLRRSAARNTSSRATPPLIAASAAGEVQPQSGASITPKIRSAIPAADSARPRTSRRGVAGSRDVGTDQATRTAMTAATPASRQKMLPHQNRSSSHPPTMGPAAMPTPVVAPHSPIARARSPRSVNTLTSSDSVAGNISAAPAPMAARAAISSLVVAENAPARLAAANSSRPMSRAPLRPNRSDRLPAASTRAAKARL